MYNLQTDFSVTNHNILPFLNSQVENPITFDQIIHGHELIQRANDSGKGLSKTARILASMYRKMIDKSITGYIPVTHDFISKTTETGRRNNNLIHKQLANIFNIIPHQVYYHQTANGEKKLRDVCVISFTENGRFILDNPPRERAKNFPLMSKKLPDLGKKISQPYIVDNNNNINIKEIAKEASNLIDSNAIEKETGLSILGCKTTTEMPKAESVPNLHKLKSDLAKAELSFNLNIPKEVKEVTTMKNEILPEKRKLKDFYPIAEADHEELKELSGRYFSLDEMNSILLKLADKFKDFSFDTKRQFMNCMSKLLRNEKEREGLVKEYQMPEEKKQEKYLAEIEADYHEISPLAHFRRRIAVRLEREAAYNLLRAFNRIEIVKGIFKLYLSKHVELGEDDKNELLAQAKSTHEQIDFGQLNNLEADTHTLIDQIEVIMPKKQAKYTPSTPVIEEKPDESGMWYEVRQRLLDTYLEGHDKSWFSKLKQTRIDEDNKIVYLKAPTAFIKGWIESDAKYCDDISSLFLALGYKYEIHL